MSMWMCEDLFPTQQACTRMFVCALTALPLLEASSVTGATATESCTPRLPSPTCARDLRAMVQGAHPGCSVNSVPC